MIKFVRWVLLLGCMGLMAFEAHAVNPMAAAGPDLSFGVGADGKIDMWASDPIGALRPGRIVMATTVTPPAQADCLFNWAEGAYPTLFAPAGAASITLAPWYYRYYSQTQAYLGTSSADNHVYYKGPASNFEIFDAGPVSNWLATAVCQ